jgi:hypothetical protein
MDAQSCAKQNNMMMAICLASSLMAEAQARLLTYRNEYTFDGVEYTPLMYKIIMRLVAIDSVATTQTLHENLQNLGVFAMTSTSSMASLTGITCSCWLAAPLSMTLLGSCSMPTLSSPAHNFTEYLHLLPP